MRRIAALIVLGALLHGVTPASAKQEPGRDVRVTYVTGGTSIPLGNGFTVREHTEIAGISLLSVTVPTRQAEKRVSVTVQDVAAPRVLVSVTQPAMGREAQEPELGRFCSDRVPPPLPLVRPGQPVVVYLLSGMCSGGPAAAIMGTVHLRFLQS